MNPPAVGKGSPPVVQWAASRVGKTVSPVSSLGTKTEEMDRLTGNDPVSRPCGAENRLVGVAKLGEKVAPRDKWYRQTGWKLHRNTNSLPKFGPVKEFEETTPKMNLSAVLCGNFTPAP